jgi:hypothetical protein
MAYLIRFWKSDYQLVTTPLCGVRSDQWHYTTKDTSEIAHEPGLGNGQAFSRFFKKLGRNFPSPLGEEEITS